MLIGKKYRELINKSIFFKILVYIIIPVFIIFLLNLYINFYYSNELKQNVIEQHVKTLNIVSNSVNQSLQQVLTASNLLTLDPSTKDIMYSTDPNLSQDYGQTFTILNTIKQYKSVSEFITGVAIFNRTSKEVFSDYGKSNMDYYFTTGDGYVDYPVKYWENLVVSTFGFQVLAPTKKILSNKTVIPLVSNGFWDTQTPNFIIVDIDCSQIMKVFLNNTPKQTGNMYLFDPQTKVVIGERENTVEQNMFADEKFIQQIQSSRSFTYNYKGNNYLIVRSISEKGILSKVLYVSVTPTKELLSSLSGKQFLIFGISIIAMFLLIFIIYWLSKGLYTPFQRMKNQLLETGVVTDLSKHNELEFINKQLQAVIDMNKNMKFQLQAALPLVCEQYLLGLLNSKDEIFDQDADEFLNKNGIFFEQEHFVVATIRVKYTDKFYEEFNHDQYLEVNYNLSSLFQMLFTEYTSFLISPRKDSLILIINAEENEKSFQNIIHVLTNTVKAFDTDKELLRINIGVGNIYAGYEGMRQSYEESQSVSFMQINALQNDLVLYTGKQEISSYYNYTIDDENKMFNYIVKGDIEEVNQVLRQIVEKNLEQGINHLGIKFLYQQIYNTAVRVLQMKEITETELMQESYININIAIDMMDSEQLINYIHQFVAETVSYTNLTATKMDMKGIIKYIDENFTQDIYLESIAEHFKISSKHLSKLIRNHFGISFGEYLARLRIEEAKKLLADSYMPINDIIEKTGFNSRNTFIRTFKKYVGVLPSDYRNSL